MGLDATNNLAQEFKNQPRCPSFAHIVKASTAAELQQAAAAMIKETGGVASALTHRIAKAGCCGRYPNNVPRDIGRALELPLASLLAVFKY